MALHGALMEHGTAQAGSAYAFPDVHAFAPFYTLQPNPRTAAAQVDLWARLVLEYCAAHHCFELSVSTVWERTPDLFCERKLDRALSRDMLRVVFAYMVDKGRAMYDPPLPRGYKVPRVGHIEADRRMHALSVAAAHAQPSYDVEHGSRIWVYWRTPTEWGDVLYAWIKETGQIRSVLTLYELEHSPFALRTHMPLVMLKQALDTLVARRRAQMFSSDAHDENLGIKFV